MNSLNKNIELIKNKEDFLKFFSLLINDLKKNDWENNTLENYLQSMESWIEDMEGYFENIKDYEALKGLSDNRLDWKLLAQILLAATMYE